MICFLIGKRHCCEQVSTALAARFTQLEAVLTQMKSDSTFPRVDEV
jgi:hypothetical protein